MTGHSSTLDIVTQRVRRRVLGDAGGLYRALEGALEGLVVQVVAPDDAAARVCGMMVLRKHPEPRPGRACARVLALQCVGHLDAGCSGLDIGRPDQPGAAQLMLQFRCQ